MNSLEKAEQIQDVAALHFKGFSDSKIAEKLKISPATVKSAMAEYNAYIGKRAANDNFLENFKENILVFEDQFNEINKHLWETIDEAQEAGVMSTKIQALRLAKDLTETKAKLLQLMTPQMNSGYLEKSRRIERVNTILSSIIREIVSDCPRCSELAMGKLEEVFMMRGEEEEDETTVRGDESESPRELASGV
jgi:predicted transcriptional regulator